MNLIIGFFYKNLLFKTGIKLGQPIPAPPLFHLMNRTAEEANLPPFVLTLLPYVGSKGRI